MSINFENALGIHADALKLRGRRNELLAANLANADTPGFKAKDIDFKSVFRSVRSDRQLVRINTTQEGHIQPHTELSAGSVKYRIPHQASIDGNTVESQIEQAKFAENSIKYQATLRFLSGRFSGILTAIKGD